MSLPILPVLVQQVFCGDSEEVPIFLHPTIPRLVLGSVIPREKTWQVSARLGVPRPSLSQDLLLPPTLPAAAAAVDDQEEDGETSRQYYETERFVNSQSSTGSGQGGEYEAIQPTLLQWDEEEEKEEHGRHLRKRPTYLVRAPTASTNEAEITFYDRRDDNRQARALLPLPAKHADSSSPPMSSLLRRLAAQHTTTTTTPHSKRTKPLLRRDDDVDDDDVDEDDDHLPRLPPPSTTAPRQASMLAFVTKRTRM